MTRDEALNACAKRMSAIEGEQPTDIVIAASLVCLCEMARVIEFDLHRIAEALKSAFVPPMK